MKVEIVANGTVSFALIPENDMDRAAMKMLLKQNNEFVEITKQTQILNKASFSEGLVIQPKARETNLIKEAIAPGANQEMGLEEIGASLNSEDKYLDEKAMK